MMSDEMREEIARAVDGASRAAVDLDDHDLDREIAVAQAKRDAAAAHKRPDSAELWNEVCCALVDVRQERRRTLRAFEDMTCFLEPPC